MGIFEGLTSFFHRLLSQSIFRGFFESNPIIITVLCLAVAALICFFGYKWFRFWCALIGFAAFYAIGIQLAGLFDPGDIVTIGIGLFCGVIGAVISFTMVRVGVFILSAGITLGVLYVLTGGNLSISVLVAVMVGVLSFWLSDYIIIGICSAGGALTLSSGLSYVLDMGDIITILLSVVFFGTGLTMQIISRKKGMFKKK